MSCADDEEVSTVRVAMECDHFYRFWCTGGAKIEREGNNPLSIALALPCRIYTKSVPVRHGKNRLSFYSIPIRNKSSLFYPKHPEGIAKKLVNLKKPSG
jgi:hypothetical protein